MSRLFKSDRIFFDGACHNGGILVNKDGKIEEVFLNPCYLNEWLNENSVEEVNIMLSIVLIDGYLTTDFLSLNRFSIIQI